MDLNSTLEGILSDLGIFSAEILLIAGSVVFLMLGLVIRSVLIKKLYLGILLLTSLLAMSSDFGLYFNGFVIIDGLSIFLRYLFIAVFLTILIFRRKDHFNEFYFLGFGVLIGSMFMVSTLNLLLIYLAIELTSYSSYLLTALNLSKRSSEASIKYLLFGGVTSAIMLFGISLIYGASGQLLLSEIPGSVMGLAGMLMFLAGALFKSSIIPFHLWVPSTYQEAPTDAVALFAVVPKLAGFGLIWHVLPMLPMELNDHIVNFLILLSLLTVLWGTLVALLQKNVKRMVSYGAIAHSGFLLPLVCLGNPEADRSFIFYAVIYAIMTIAVFYFIHSLEQKLQKSLYFDDLSGLGKSLGHAGFGITVIMVSLVGLPPTAGFMAKLVLFSNIWEFYEANGSMIFIIFFVLGILSTVLSLFFYIRIPYFLFLRDSNTDLKFDHLTLVVTTFFAIALLTLFIRPDLIDNIAVMSSKLDHLRHE